MNEHRIHQLNKLTLRDMSTYELRQRQRKGAWTPQPSVLEPEVLKTDTLNLTSSDCSTRRLSCAFLDGKFSVKTARLVVDRRSPVVRVRV